MFALFEELHPNVKCSFSSYKVLFYKYFNLRRKAPVKDTCNVCDAVQIQIDGAPSAESKADLQRLKDDHIAFGEGF
jgi:hypothetical protein